MWNRDRTPEQIVQYRGVIDEVVRELREGSGMRDPRRILDGIPADRLDPDRYAPAVVERGEALNALRASLSEQQRDLLAQMVFDAFDGGVFATLEALHAYGVEPFDEGYEGDPHSDYVGRTAGLGWPDEDGRWGESGTTNPSRYPWHEEGAAGLRAEEASGTEETP